MRVVPPILIDDSKLVSSSAAEPTAGSPSTESVWNSGATYALGAIVISTSTHRTYESLQAANLNNPLPVLPETSTAWWLDMGPTNKWAMFDLYRNTQTISPSPLVVVVSPGDRINAVGLSRLNGTSLTISLDAVGSPAVNYYTHSEQLVVRDALVDNWFDWFFGAFISKTELAQFDLPPFASAKLTVTITNTGGPSACGGMVIGTAKTIGQAQRDAQLDLLQFSVITRDLFGEATLIPRRSIPTAQYRLLLPAGSVQSVYDLLAGLDAVPALYSAAEDTEHVLFAPLLIFGIYRSVSFKVADPDSELDLKIEAI